MRPKGKARRGRPWRTDAATEAGWGALAGWGVDGLYYLGYGSRGWPAGRERKPQLPPLSSRVERDLDLSSLQWRGIIFSELGTQWWVILAEARASISVPKLSTPDGRRGRSHMIKLLILE